MDGKVIKLGYAPTRRSIFSAPDAIKYRGLTKERLLELGVSFVDIDDINPEGLLYDDKDVAPILEKFRKEKVDGLFVPHCNFGTEYVVARLARQLGVPVLLWGPRDERPDENGVRLRDSQCGLLRAAWFQVPFTLHDQLPLDPSSSSGEGFLAVRNVVKVFRRTRFCKSPCPLISSDYVQRGRAAGEVQHPAVPHPPAGADRPGESRRRRHSVKAVMTVRKDGDCLCYRGR